MKRIIIILVATFGLWSCSKDKEEPTPPVVNFTLSKTEVALEVGQSVQITAQGGQVNSILPSSPLVEFIINKTEITIKALAVGETTFTFHSAGQKATLKVIVTAPPALQGGLGVYTANGSSLLQVDYTAYKPQLIWLAQGDTPYQKYIQLGTITPSQKVNDPVNVFVKSKGIDVLAGKTTLVGKIERIDGKFAQIRTSDGLQIVTLIQ